LELRSLLESSLQTPSYMFSESVTQEPPEGSVPPHGGAGGLSGGGGAPAEGGRGLGRSLDLRYVIGQKSGGARRPTEVLPVRTSLGTAGLAWRRRAPKQGSKNTTTNEEASFLIRRFGSDRGLGRTAASLVGTGTAASLAGPRPCWQGPRPRWRDRGLGGGDRDRGLAGGQTAR